VREKFYRDVAVVAYPVRGVCDRMRLASPAIKASSQEFVDACEPEAMFDSDGASYWSSSAGRAGGEFVDLSFPKPFVAESVYILPRNGWTPGVVDLFVSEDGKNYRAVAKQTMPPNQPLVMAIPSTTSRWFRVAFPSSQSADGRVGIAELRLLVAGEDPGRVVKLGQFAEQIATHAHSPSGLSAMWRGGDLSGGRAPDLSLSQVVDLTAFMDKQGGLRWDAPPGDWEILRFGRTSLGERARVGGSDKAYQVDYLDPATMQTHFTQGIDPLLKGIGHERGSALFALHEDSFEMPFNRWTGAFASEFRKRRGYDLTLWLPALAGRIVESQGASERFLWDYRRTIADLYVTHWETAREECHRRGLKFESEAAGPSPYCFDALAQLGRADIPMGEFWSGIYRPGVPVDMQRRGCWDSPACETIRQTASAAHLYGKPLVAAESFTGYSRPFVLDPYDVKAFGDRALCDGLNRFVIHLFMTQPMEEFNGKPVVVRLHAFDYNRRTTWFEQSRFWTDYLARCCAMLQSGKPVADVCCFLGEGAPALVPQREFMFPQIPAGYDYDACNAESLLRASVRDGRITFPSGASYALLTLPPEQRSMTPGMLRHLRDLVRAGATVLGQKTRYSPSLSERETADRKVRELADELWGETTDAAGEHSFGRGRVIWGKPLAEVLAAVSCPPAFTAQGVTSVLFVQRRTKDADIFFLSNQATNEVQFTGIFRTTAGMKPELWDPATGRRVKPATWKSNPASVEIPLQLDPRGSVFVVLRQEPSESCEGASPRVAANEPALDLSTEWEISFDALRRKQRFEKLVSWTTLPEEELRCFSGTATYRKRFRWSSSARRVELDLGAVKNIAEVTFNGSALGVLWKPPFRVDVTQALKPGENELEVRVTNLLVNRITGDFALPPNQRHLHVFGAIEQYRAGAEADGLLPSGILGPVTVRGMTTE